MMCQPAARLFLSTLSLRRATNDCGQYCIHARISIHALLAESDGEINTRGSEKMISIHALLAESDCFFCVKLLLQLIFLSTLSLRRATIIRQHSEPDSGNFYPRSPCGERLNDAINGCNPDIISIHALLAESDRRLSQFGGVFQISIHALLAESDGIIKLEILSDFLFLSTLSLRRATREPTALRTPHHIFLSTLSLRRATTWARGSRVTYVISIHALLAESDRQQTYQLNEEQAFLSTLSLRRATTWARGSRATYVISIHALLAESD